MTTAEPIWPPIRARCTFSPSATTGSAMAGRSAFSAQDIPRFSACRCWAMAWKSRTISQRRSRWTATGWWSARGLTMARPTPGPIRAPSTSSPLAMRCSARRCCSRSSDRAIAAARMSRSGGSRRTIFSARRSRWTERGSRSGRSVTMAPRSRRAMPVPSISSLSPTPRFRVASWRVCSISRASTAAPSTAKGRCSAARSRFRGTFLRSARRATTVLADQTSKRVRSISSTWAMRAFPRRRSGLPLWVWAMDRAAPTISRFRGSRPGTGSAPHSRSMA